MNNKIIAPILTENKVNSIAEKYCKKYNLNGSLAYKITAIKFLPDGMKSYGLDIPLWMVVRDVKGWGCMEIRFFFSGKKPPGGPRGRTPHALTTVVTPLQGVQNGVEIWR
ncbi:hypothetical protein ACISSW_26980 [Escherichia coli]